MKAFLIAWVIIQLVLLIVGHIWRWLDWKNEKRKKAPYLITAIGCFMMALYFLYLVLRN